MPIETKLLKEIRDCRHCEKYLPLGPRPVLNYSRNSKIVIIGQAPGTRVHETGVPWNDPSGERLREWMGVGSEQFYDPSIFGIVPMGFCYPGKGKSGDLPPRPECSQLWMDKVLKDIKSVELILLIGKYSQDYFLGETKKKTLTETVKAWKEYLPKYLVLPHPSPRNNIWLKKNEWFEEIVVPSFKKLIRKSIKN